MLIPNLLSCLKSINKATWTLSLHSADIVIFGFLVEATEASSGGGGGGGGAGVASSAEPDVAAAAGHGHHALLVPGG